jgi:hypothetical protein
MLSVEALRLVTMEVLRPHAAVVAKAGFPTVAGPRVYDSQEIPLQAIDPDRQYTPVIGLYSGDASSTPRGEASDFTDSDHRAVLDIVVELAIRAADDNGEFADAMAANDPQARLVLSALCSKIRFLLQRSAKGVLWRKLVKRVVSCEAMPFAIPDLGLRFQRVTLRYTVELRDDCYDLDSGGLPEPLRSVAASLPAGSYAKEKLAELAGYFLAETPDALEEIAGAVKLPGAEQIEAGWTAGT